MSLQSRSRSIWRTASVPPNRLALQVLPRCRTQHLSRQLAVQIPLRVAVVSLLQLLPHRWNHPRGALIMPAWIKRVVVEEEVLSYLSNKKSKGAVPQQQLGTQVKVVELLNITLVVVLLILSSEEAVLSEVPPSPCMISHVLWNWCMKWVNSLWLEICKNVDILSPLQHSCTPYVVHTQVITRLNWIELYSARHVYGLTNWFSLSIR